MIKLNYFGATLIIGGIIGAGSAIGSGINASKARRAAEREAKLQRELAERQMAMQQLNEGRAQAYYKKAEAGEQARDKMAEDMDASDIVAQKIAGREANRAADQVREQSMAAAKQAGMNSPLAAMLGMAQAGGAAQNTRAGTYGQQMGNALTGITNNNQNLLGMGGVMNQNALAYNQAGNQMMQNAGNIQMQGVMNQQQMLGNLLNMGMQAGGQMISSGSVKAPTVTRTQA